MKMAGWRLWCEPGGVARGYFPEEMIHVFTTVEYRAN